MWHKQEKKYIELADKTKRRNQVIKKTYKGVIFFLDEMKVDNY